LEVSLKEGEIGVELDRDHFELAKKMLIAEGMWINLKLNPRELALSPSSFLLQLCK